MTIQQCLDAHWPGAKYDGETVTVGVMKFALDREGWGRDARWVAVGRLTEELVGEDYHFMQVTTPWPPSPILADSLTDLIAILKPLAREALTQTMEMCK